MQNRQAAPAGSTDGGRATRVRRFAELVETAFGEKPEDMDMQLDDEGPWKVKGIITYQGRSHVLTYGRNPGASGKWWFFDGKPMFQHQGRNSLKNANLNRLLDAISGNWEAPMTTRLEAPEEVA
jgi:hypothetical protein